jgi:predicted amino acid-binding ACT domain protein
MHGLNIARVANAVLSQALSIIAIIGFFFTVTTSAQLHTLWQQFCPERRIQVQVPKRRGRG